MAKNHFCKILQPSQYNGKEPFTGTILKRDVSENATNYQKKHGLDARNFGDHIDRPNGKKYSMVPMTSPTLVFYNNDPVNRKDKITKPTSGFEKEGGCGMAKMPREVEEKYSAQALEQISQKLPHGDVTSNKFNVRVSSLMPSNRKEGHRRWAEKTEDGKKELSARDESSGAPCASSRWSTV